MKRPLVEVLSFRKLRQLAESRKLPANPLNHTHKEVVAEKLYLFQLGFSLQEEELRRMASAQVAAQFGFQLVRRDGEWDKENPTAHPENGQRLAGYVGIPYM